MLNVISQIQDSDRKSNNNLSASMSQISNQKNNEVMQNVINNQYEQYYTFNAGNKNQEQWEVGKQEYKVQGQQDGWKGGKIDDIKKLTDKY